MQPEPDRSRIRPLVAREKYDTETVFLQRDFMPERHRERVALALTIVQATRRFEPHHDPPLIPLDDPPTTIVSKAVSEGPAVRRADR